MKPKYVFLAKTAMSGEWIYGDLIQYESGEMAILNRFSAYGSEATEISKREKVNPATVELIKG